jgi:DNA mismatch repair ATPase MutS
MLKSFVEYISANPSLHFKPPLFNPHGFFHLKDTVHPILAAINESPETTKAKTLTSAKHQNSSLIQMSSKKPMMLVLGANMSGKTTLLKQVGCLQIMAQCGCFIPSTSSHSQSDFGLAKQILSVSNDSSDSLNVLTQSSFEQEMFETSCILKSLTPNTIVLVDELCRSTYFLEGFVLSLALCDYLLAKVMADDKSGIRVLFATHYKHLAYLSGIHSKLSVVRLQSGGNRDNRSECESNYTEESKCDFCFFISNKLIYFFLIVIFIKVKSLLNVMPLPIQIIKTVHSFYSRFHINLEVLFQLKCIIRIRDF